MPNRKFPGLPLGCPKWDLRRVIVLTVAILATFLVLSTFNLQPPGPPPPPALPLDTHYGRISEINANSKLAITTYLTGFESKKNEPDRYWEATRVLTYQLLYDEKSRIRNENIDWIVFVSARVDESKRAQLRADGAKVVEVEDVPTAPWVQSSEKRWADQFNKLRLFEWTQYDRILFIDADTLIRGPLDDIFSETTKPIDTKTDAEGLSIGGKGDEAQLPASYLFCARSDNAFGGKRWHPFPPKKSNNLSAGFWIVAPSKELAKYLTSVMPHKGRFNPHTMEQSLLNYAFRREGAMPWCELGDYWSATWPNSKDVEAGVATLHEKFWKTGPKELTKLWWDKREEMLEYWAKQEGKSSV